MAREPDWAGGELRPVSAARGEDSPQGRDARPVEAALAGLDPGHRLPVWGWRAGSPSQQGGLRGRAGAARPTCVRVGAQAER